MHIIVSYISWGVDMQCTRHAHRALQCATRFHILALQVMSFVLILGAAALRIDIFT